MKLFSKNKAGNDSSRKEELASKIATGIIKTQTRIADYLNGKTKNLSGKAKLTLLILFCILFAATNIYLIIYSY